jgi:anti-sigma-K factor RskA
MSNEPHAIELLPAYALGSLDAEEANQVAEHLAVCPVCRAELASYQAVADQLALAAPDAAPPAALKQQLLGRLQTPHAAPESAVHESWWQRLVGLFGSGAPVWGIVSLALVAVLVISNLLWWQHANRHEPEGMQVVAMVGTDAAPHAEGTLVISADGEYGTLVVDGLPELDRAQQYQLWLIRDEQRTSGGVFSVNEEGYGALLISSDDPLSSYPSFGITIEPAGGSPGPTGDKVLGGSL